MKERLMRIPTTLRHKPVIVCEDYNLIDGREDPSETKGLSVGLAQWNERGKMDISAKIWRYTGKKWSRQSEEMPLYRVIDLAILICRTILHFREAYRYKKLYDPLNPRLERIPLQGGALDIIVCTENPMIDEDIRLFEHALRKDDELLSERLVRLSAVLKELGY
jgi:hypothetical protein